MSIDLKVTQMKKNDFNPNVAGKGDWASYIPSRAQTTSFKIHKDAKSLDNEELSLFGKILIVLIVVLIFSNSKCEITITDKSNKSEPTKNEKN